MMKTLLPLLAMAAVTPTLFAQNFPPPAELPAHAGFPDPLKTFAGEAVTSAEQWKSARAPELRRLFQHYEYGQMPAAPAKVDAKLAREDRNALGGKATIKELTLSWGLPDVEVHLLLVIPNNRQAPAPAFIGMNFAGNHAVLADPAIRLPVSWMYAHRTGAESGNRATDASRGKEVENWAIEQTIDRGYAVACFYSGDVVPDDAKLAAERLKLFKRDGSAPDAGDDTATIAAWASGFMRVVDYLHTDSDIDAKRIAVVGHSRNGKTALLAAAMDERIALAIPSQAGAGGTAPARVSPELAAPGKNGRPTAETIAVINKNFPHWFCTNFKAFNDAPEKLPFDHHSLIALCAPRPVLLSNAKEDVWANPAGQFEMLREADPVYQLVAKDGLGSKEMPELGKLLPSRLGYFIREGEHSMTRQDWAAWLDYADVWLKK